METPATRRQRLIDQIPTGGTGAGPTPQPDPTQSASGSELGRNVSNTLMALPGVGPGMGAASRLAGSALGKTATATTGAMALAKPALPYAPPLAGAAALGAVTPSAQTAQPAPVATQSTATAPTMPRTSPGAPNPASGSPDEVMPEGKVNVRRQGNGVLEFSGKNISGDVQYTGSAADRMAGKGGNVSVVPGMSQALIDKTLTNPDGSRWSAGDNAIMAANLRDGVDPMRGTQQGIARDKAERLMNLATAPNGTPGKSNAVKLLAMQESAKAQSSQQQLERDRQAQAGEGVALENTSKRQMLDAQRAVTTAKTPEERKSAVELLAGLQGKTAQTPEEYAYAPGGQEVDPASGQLVTRPGVIFNKRTGQTVQPGQAQGQSINTDPRAIAIRDNPKLTPEQKRSELNKIGYQ